MRLLKSREEAIKALVGRPMKHLILEDVLKEEVSKIPYVFGEPSLADYTFGPALTWVFEFKSLTFAVYTDLEGNWNMDAQRVAHWIKIDEFTEALIEKLNAE